MVGGGGEDQCYIQLLGLHVLNPMAAFPSCGCRSGLSQLCVLVCTSREALFSCVLRNKILLLFKILLNS